MATTYVPPESGLGCRILEFRKTNKLTQADLAAKYDVSGPAIFKFEKGYVTPSLRLWQKMAEDFGIPEKEAVTLWAREKLPPRFADLISKDPVPDIESVIQEIDGSSLPQGDTGYRKLIETNPEVSPSLKKFVANDQMWAILKPNKREIVFLVQLDAGVPRLAPDQFRDALLTARDIRAAAK